MSTPEAEMRRYLSQRRKPQFVEMDYPTRRAHKQKNRKEGAELFRRLREQGIDPYELKRKVSGR